MSSSPSGPLSASVSASPRRASAAFPTLDSRGRVVQANARAGELWGTDARALVGLRFPQLFQFEVVSGDPEMQDAQWEVLAGNTGAPAFPLEAKPLNGDPMPVRVQLETVAGEPEGYFALVQPAPPPGAPAPTAAAPASTPWGSDLLAVSTAVGFFDLQFRAGQFRYAPAWKRLLGYSAADLDDTYDTWLRLLHPDDSGAAPDRLGRKAAPGEQRTFSVECRMKHRAGQWVWVHVVGVQTFTTASEVDRVAGVMLDITERKEWEEMGMLADERLSQLTGDGGLAVFDVDFVAGTVMASSAWQALTARATDSPTLEQLAAHFGQSSGAELAKHWQELAKPDAWLFRSVGLKRADHVPVGVWLGLHRHFSKRGEVVRAIGFAVPTLLMSGAGGHIALAALDAVREGVIIADRSARVLHLNKKAQQLTGFTLSRAREQTVDLIFRLRTLSDGKPAEDAIWTLAESTELRLDNQHALVPADGGNVRPIVWSVSEARDADDQGLGVVIVFRDPAEMPLNPEELLRANRFETLGQLAGGIAHDFNNLLTTILGGVSQAKESRDPTYLEDAESACMAAKTLTRQLLDLAKGSGGDNLQVMKPADILRDSLRIAAAGASTKVTLELDEDSGPVEVDRGQMLQVFQNLIINAIQAMADPAAGEIWLRCRSLKLASGQLENLPAGRYVQMEVQDNGSGIPADHLQRIFDPFFTTKKQGTGLGLATALSIVRHHGGELGVESIVGVGTTFCAFLPVCEHTVQATTRRAPTLRFGTGRVLLMDDDPKITQLTGAMLASLEYAYDVARNGEEALVLYRRQLNVNRPYDAVILDLTIIGGMGGEACFKHLRELNPDVRAIVSSGYDNDRMMKQFLEQGFAAYLTKPYRVTELGNVLRSVLGK